MPLPPSSTTVEEVGSSFSVSYTVGGWTGRRVRDTLHIDSSSFPVTFDLIKEAYNGFFVAGAEWVGIWGMAFSELAKVCVCVYGVCGVCVCARVRTCVFILVKGEFILTYVAQCTNGTAEIDSGL